MSLLNFLTISCKAHIAWNVKRQLLYRWVLKAWLWLNICWDILWWYTILDYIMNYEHLFCYWHNKTHPVVSYINLFLVYNGLILFHLLDSNVFHKVLLVSWFHIARSSSAFNKALYIKTYFHIMDHFMFCCEMHFINVYN